MSSRLAASNWFGETMPRRALLIAGLIALAGSIVGPWVQTSITGDATWWGSHMFGTGGHMGWTGQTGSTNRAIEGAREVVITATEFVLSPSEPTVELGGVNLTLKNEGQIPHDLVIADLGVRLAAGPGQQVTTGIEAVKTGSFDFLCTYPGHAESGMTGVLLIVPNQ
jgi:hypothetical protein